MLPSIPRAITTPPPVPHSGPHQYGACQKLPWGGVWARVCTIAPCTASIPC